MCSVASRDKNSCGKALWLFFFMFMTFGTAGAQAVAVGDSIINPLTGLPETVL